MTTFFTFFLIWGILTLGVISYLDRAERKKLETKLMLLEARLVDIEVKQERFTYHG